MRAASTEVLPPKSAYGPDWSLSIPMRTTLLGLCASATLLRNSPTQNRPIKAEYRIDASQCVRDGVPFTALSVTATCILFSALIRTGKVTWTLPFKLGKIARDRRYVEASEDRFLGLAVEQEPERRLETALRGMLARRQPFAHLLRHRDVVTSLAVSFANEHLENGRGVFGGASDVDHIDPFKRRASIRRFSRVKRI